MKKTILENMLFLLSFHLLLFYNLGTSIQPNSHWFLYSTAGLSIISLISVTYKLVKKAERDKK